MSSKPLSLKATGLSSNEQGFSNCCFVHPAESARLCAAAGLSEEDKVVKGAWVGGGGCPRRRAVACAGGMGHRHAPWPR